MTSLVLAGCGGTGAQIEANRIRTVTTETIASGRTCLQSIVEKPEYAPLRSKTVVDPDGQYSLQMLNDTTSPNKKEIALLYQGYGEVQQCRKILLDGASKAHPLFLLTLVESYSESDRLWAQATAGKLTWGQFNEGRKNLGAQTQAKLIQVDAQIASQLQNQHQAEMENRQRAAAAFQQWAVQQQQIALQQQAINAANRPRTITCNYFGNTAQCNSF